MAWGSASGLAVLTQEHNAKSYLSVHNSSLLPHLLYHGVTVKSDKRVYKSEIRRNASQMVSMLLVRHLICTVVSEFRILSVSFLFFDVLAKQLQLDRQ